MVFAIWDKSSVIALLAPLGGEPADGLSAKKRYRVSNVLNILR